MTFKICMIEDDSDLANLIKEHLVRYDFEIFICEDFKNIDKFSREKRAEVRISPKDEPFVRELARKSGISFTRCA